MFSARALLEAIRMAEGYMSIHQAKNLIILSSCIVIIVAILYNVLSQPTVHHSHSLPIPPDLIGRQEESLHLRSILKFSAEAPRIISITGGPGFGKSALAIHIGHEISDKGVDVNYVDLNDDTANKYEVENQIKLVVVGRNLSAQQLDLYEWGKSLKHETLLILDNCDEQFHTNKDALQTVVTKLVRQSMYIKVLTTSRRQVSYVDRHEIYPIKELSSDHACELLHGITKSLINGHHCAIIAKLTGSVPLVLHVVGALLNMPDSPGPQKIIIKLNESLIETLSPDELRTEDTVNASIAVSYHYLGTAMQEAGRYLSYFPGSFSENAACEILQNTHAQSPNDCKAPRLLVKRSLLARNERVYYVYHRLIREFFRDMSTEAELRQFYLHFMEYYSPKLLREDYAPQFFDDEQNFRHLFSILSDKHAKFKSINKNEASVLMKAVENIGNMKSDHFILKYGFAPSEARNYFANILSYIERYLRKPFGEAKFFPVYLKIVMHLVRIDRSHIKDVNALIKNMRRHIWVFESSAYEQYVPTTVHSSYFSTLASYYLEVQNHEKAKWCHEKLLWKEGILWPFECGGKCNSLQLAKAFARKNDKKRSLLYSDRERDLIIQFDVSVSQNEIIDVVVRLTQLYQIYSMYDDSHSTIQVTNKLIEVTKDITVQPSEAIKYVVAIFQVMKILQSMNITSELEVHKLENSIVTGLNEADLHEVIDDLYELYIQDEFETVIFIGKHVYNIISQEAKWQNDLDYNYMLSQLLSSIGDSLYHLGRYTESMFYYRKLVEVSQHKKRQACFRLMLFGSFKCIPQLLDLLWEDTQDRLGYLKFIWNGYPSHESQQYDNDETFNADVTKTSGDVDITNLKDITGALQYTLLYHFSRFFYPVGKFLEFCLVVFLMCLPYLIPLTSLLLCAYCRKVTIKLVLLQLLVLAFVYVYLFIESI